MLIFQQIQRLAADAFGARLLGLGDAVGAILVANHLEEALLVCLERFALRRVRRIFSWRRSRTDIGELLDEPSVQVGGKHVVVARKEHAAVADIELGVGLAGFGVGETAYRLGFDIDDVDVALV
ncbi:MAG TPA: hypothetical protein VFU90_03915, partial [Candidatus Tumulicola sp.]|nr:hypothetical protein [Candidatus Tumulicola sp.]